MPVRVGISQRIVQTVRIQIPALWIGGILAHERIVRTRKPAQRSIADTDWRLRRIAVLEMALFAKGRIEFAELFEEHELAARPHLIDAHTFIRYEKQIRNRHLQEARLSPQFQ